MKNVLVISGSPRKNGNTELLASAFAEGAKEAGNNVEIYSVAGKNIRGCTGCNACRKTPNNACVFKDDMADCYQLMKTADVIVFASPVFFYGVSSQLKALIDRLHNPIRGGFSVKKLALLLVCADTDEATFDAIKAMYYSNLKYFSLEDGGIVAISGIEQKGAIANDPRLKLARELGESI